MLYYIKIKIQIKIIKTINNIKYKIKTTQKLY